MVKITKEGIIAIHEIIQKRHPLKQKGILDESKLEDIANRPDLSVFGHTPYNTVFKKAASLMEGVIRGHAFFDGNKRTGLMLTLVYLQFEGKYLVMPKDVIRFTVKVASDVELDEKSIDELIDEIAIWLKKHSATNGVNFLFKVLRYTLLPLLGLLVLEKIGIKKYAERKLIDWYALEFHGDYIDRQATSTTEFIFSSIIDTINAIKQKKS